MHRAFELLDRRPGAGYVASATSTGLSFLGQLLPGDPFTMIGKWIQVIAWMGVLIGVATGVLTFMIQFHRLRRIRLGIDSESPFPLQVQPGTRPRSYRHNHPHR